VVDRGRAEQWLFEYVRAWRAADSQMIEILFAPEIRYVASPFEEAIVGRDAVVESWLYEGVGDEVFDADYRVEAVDGDVAVASGTTTYAPTETDAERVFSNVFMLRFDADGRCVEYREWWVEKDD